MAINIGPNSVNTTIARDPAVPLGVSAGSGVTRSTDESGKTEAETRAASSALSANRRCGVIFCVIGMGSSSAFSLQHQHSARTTTGVGRVARMVLVMKTNPAHGATHLVAALR